MNPGFEIGRQIGNNFAQTRRAAKDENVIESILSNAMNAGDPAVLQQSIGKIISQVSPERQGAALQYLQGVHSNLQRKQELAKVEQREKEAAEKAGYTPWAPPAVQAQQAKDKAKAERLGQYGLGGMTGMQNQSPEQISPFPSFQSPFSQLTDEQLVLTAGAPDREASEPAKAELKLRADKKDLEQKRQDNWTKFGMERAKKVLDKAEEIAHSLPVKNTALKLMVDSIANKDLSFFTPDNLAEITGIEAFRSSEGAIFKTAGKEYFLGNISRAGARPNQWIEQQIADMMTKIGRSTEANLSVARALQNETLLDEERVRLTEEIFTDMKNNNEDIGDLGTRVNKRLSKFAEQKQNELFNDLRAIKAIGEGKPQKFHKVSEGSKISPYMVDALLNAFNNDPEKAMKEAKKLGYSIE